MTYDGNGNVCEYLDATGSSAAHYEYDPFGRTIVTTGPQAAEFAYQFSTKPLDVTTGLHYYGYRWYDAGAGRWINRDPIEERGGVNLYGFVYNRSLLGYDLLGYCAKGDAKLTGQNIGVIPYVGDRYDIGRKGIEGLLKNLASIPYKDIAESLLQGYFDGYGQDDVNTRILENYEEYKKLNDSNLSNLLLVIGPQIYNSVGFQLKFEVTIYAKCCECDENGVWDFRNEFATTEAVTTTSAFATDEYWDFRTGSTNSSFYRTLAGEFVTAWTKVAKAINKKCAEVPDPHDSGDHLSPD